MNKLALLTVSFCSGAAALAQTPAVTLVAQSPVAIGSTATNPPFVGVPAGAPADALDLVSGITDVVRLRTETSSHFGTASFEIVSGVVFQNAIAPVAAGTSASPNAAGATLGPVTFLARFQAPPGAACTVVVVASANGSAGTTHVAVNRTDVDVGADGTIEVASPSPQTTVPVVASPSGDVQVRVTVDNHVFGTGLIHSTSVTQVRLLLPSSACTITPYGSGCNGAASSGTQQLSAPARLLTMSCTGAFPQQPLLSLFGFQNTGPTIGGCALLTDGAIPFLLVAPPSGSISHAVAIPHTAVGVLYHQFVSVDVPTFSIRASNGLEFRCQ